MKFQHLAIGARFEFEGKVYVKTGPVAASSGQGGQRLIPRYANLIPLDGSTPPAKPEPGRKLDEATVLAAFDVFCGTCVRLLDEPARLEFEAAKERFRVALGDKKAL
jgi:hypothetical protein